MIEGIQQFTIEQWLGELKKYQRDSITSLIDKYGEETAMEKWLSAQGPKDNVAFGGVSESDTKPFLDKFKNEFKKFVCGHPDYEEERSKLNLESPVVKALYVSVISAALGAAIGFAATLLAPVVAIMLSLVGQMGVKAYCQS